MKNQNNPHIKIRLQWELAYEIIFYSFIMISLGLVFLFASNLLRFNWFTILFLVLASILIYFKKGNFLTINEQTLKIKYGHIFTYKNFQMKEVEEFIFHSDKRMVEIKLHSDETITCFLIKSQKEKLLSYLVRYFPNIPCLYIQ